MATRCFETAGELRRLGADQADVEAHRVGEIAEAGVELLATAADEPVQRPADDAMDREAPVERGVRVLEHDLQRPHLLAVAVVDLRRDRRALELDDRSFVRRRQPEQQAGQRRLAAARLADEPERLARRQRERDVLDGADLVPVLVERLAHVAGADDRDPRLVVGTIGRLGHGDRRRVTWELLRLLVEVATAGVTVTELDTTAVPRWWQMSSASAQRSVNTQPGSSAPSAGRNPGIVSSWPWSLRAPARGMQRSSPTVYGWRGLWNTSSTAPVLDDAAGVQHTDPVAHAQDHVEVVADEQHARAELLAQRGDQIEHLRLDRGVETRRRLVEDQQRRILGRAPWRSRRAGSSRPTAGADSGPSPASGRRSAPS